MTPERPTAMDLPAWLVAPLLLGATMALAGGYWDDAWHTERGRDSFFIAPHIAIYSGIAVAGGSLGLWTALAVWRGGWRQVIRERPLVLALVSVAVTLASAPIDNAWHVAFGRDAVIWSPPHVLGIVGTAGLGIALLAELTTIPKRWARALEPVVGGLVLAAFAFLVVEYQTDVPQFDPLWYLPVLALGSVFALALVRLALERVYAATAAAAVHLVFSLVVVGFLWAAGFDRPAIPLLVLPALALDLSAQRGASLPLRAAAYVGVLFAAYVPALDLVGEGVQLDGQDVVVGLPLAWGAALLALIAVGGGTKPRSSHARLLGTVMLTAACVLALSGTALAHDPGQGKDAGTLGLVAALRGEDLRLDVAARRCSGLTAVRLVARRAGQTRHAALRGGPCHFVGEVNVPQNGRWFVYADLTRGSQTIEAWLPVKVGASQGRFVDRARFAYVVDRKPANAVKWVSGGLMYVLVAAFLAAVVYLVRSIAGMDASARLANAGKGLA